MGIPEPDIETEIETALNTLRNGGLILYPTDTIWGIGCDASNREAVDAIYSLKKRSDSKSMLSLVDSIRTLHEWVEDIPSSIEEIINLSSTPTTIIYSHPKGFASNLLADDGSIGIRVTHELFSHELCKRFGKPIVSTSANISGESAPGNFYDISGEIITGVDHIVNFRREDNSIHAPSRIIRLEKDNSISFIR